MKKSLQKGIIMLTVPVFVSGLSLVGLCSATLYGLVVSSGNDRNEIKVDVAVNSSKVKTLEDQFKTIDGKLDQLLISNGIPLK